MIEGKLKNGFEFHLEEAALDNMELLDAIAETEENPTSVGKVAELLLGKDQKKALYNFLRTAAGNVPVHDFTDAVVEILNGSKQGKN